MKFRLLLATIVLLSLAQAKEPKVYEKGVLLRMDSAECGYAEKSGKGFTGVVLGTDSAHKKTQALLCPEYVLQSDRVVYRIRPKEEKHPVLLPVGEKAEFRLKKDLMLLRVIEFEKKEREYRVISMTPRADQTASRTE